MFVNTGQEFDGSDSGARPDEAISWGKIKTDATPVKVLTFIPPILALTQTKTNVNIMFHLLQLYPQILFS